LRQAANGKLVISERLTELLAHALRSEGSHPSNAEQAELTERETQILALIAKGLSNKMIARKLDITEGTVKVHVKHLLKKLNLRSRVEAAVWALNEAKLV
jgi:two-component system nitrate/nitrite response regulator NarL